MRPVVLSLLLLASFSVRAQVPEGSDLPPDTPPAPEETPAATPEETPVDVIPLATPEPTPPLLELVTPTPVATPGIVPFGAGTTDPVKGEALHRLNAGEPIALDVVGPLTFRLSATQYFPGLPGQGSVLDVVMDGRVAKRASLASKVATGPHPVLPTWNVGQTFLVVVPIPDGPHRIELRLSSGPSTAVGLRIGAPIPATIAAAPTPTPSASTIDSIGPKTPIPTGPTGRPDLAYRTKQRDSSAGFFTGILQPSVGKGRPPTTFTGAVYRYQTANNLGFGVQAATAIFHESVPKRRWIAFQLQPIVAQAFYHFPVGEHAQPYVVGCAGAVVGRSELFVVDGSRSETTFGGGGAIGGGLEYDAFREGASLTEGRMQMFAEISTQAMFVPFQEHKRTAFVGGSLTFGALYKW